MTNAKWTGMTPVDDTAPAIADAVREAAALDRGGNPR